MAFSSILPPPERMRIQCYLAAGDRECAPTAPPPRLECTSLLRMHTTYTAHECTKRGAPWYLETIGGQSAKCAINAQKTRSECSEMRVNALRKKGPDFAKAADHAPCIQQNAETGAKNAQEMNKECADNAQEMPSQKRPRSFAKLVP